jgi:hypothetical protein
MRSPVVEPAAVELKAEDGTEIEWTPKQRGERTTARPARIPLERLAGIIIRFQ